MIWLLGGSGYGSEMEIHEMGGDPCLNLKCRFNAECRNDGGIARCVCQNGFTGTYPNCVAPEEKSKFRSHQNFQPPEKNSKSMINRNCGARDWSKKKASLELTQIVKYHIPFTEYQNEKYRNLL